MTIKLLTEHHLECLSLKGDCTGSYESTHVTIPHFWKSRVMAHMLLEENNYQWMLFHDHVMMTIWRLCLAIYRNSQHLESCLKYK